LDHFKLINIIFLDQNSIMGSVYECSEIEQKDATFVVVLIIKIYMHQRGKQKTIRRIYTKYSFQEYVDMYTCEIVFLKKIYPFLFSIINKKTRPDSSGLFYFFSLRVKKK